MGFKMSVSPSCATHVAKMFLATARASARHVLLHNCFRCTCVSVTDISNSAARNIAIIIIIVGDRRAISYRIIDD